VCGCYSVNCQLSGSADAFSRELTNKTYVTNTHSNDVTVIDGVTNSTSSVDARGNNPFAVAGEFTNQQNLCGQPIQRQCDVF